MARTKQVSCQIDLPKGSIIDHDFKTTDQVLSNFPVQLIVLIAIMDKSRFPRDTDILEISIQGIVSNQPVDV